MLIEEAGYLIDDRSYERCQGKSLKEQFAIKIDSIRKSLGIDNMRDVTLLVDSMFGHEARHKQQQKEIRARDEREFQEAQAALGNSAAPQQPEASKDQSSDEESEHDPTELRMDPEHLVAALAYFHKTREALAVEDGVNASTKKKKSNFESEEQKNERERTIQQRYWEKMTTVLS